MPSVLFVCTANRFRSPLAAALFNKLLQADAVQGSWMVASAGTWAEPGQPVLPNVAEVGRAYALDLSAHRSNRLCEQLLSEFDLILVMQSSQREALQSEFPSLYKQIYLLSEVVERRFYDIPDSSDSRQGIADVSRDLNELIRRGFHSICVLATYLHTASHSTRPDDR
jgi:protein-tyrosine phosphatase